MADGIETVIGAFLLALAVQGIITIVVYLFLPEAIREPARASFLRARKWIKNPTFQVAVTKRLALRDNMPVDEVRRSISRSLRESKLYNPGDLPKSFEFPIQMGAFSARVDLSLSYDPEVDEGMTRSIVMELASQTSYRNLRSTLENLRAADDLARQSLQAQLSLVESGPQTTIRLESTFPMSDFFRAVQPVVLRCETKDGSIAFDYAPGILTARGRMDAEMIKWLRGAIAAL